MTRQNGEPEEGRREAGITRRDALLEALRMMETRQKAASEGGRGWIPAEGREDEFYRTGTMCELIRDVVRSLENEQVRRAMADWQVEVMKEDARGGRANAAGLL